MLVPVSPSGTGNTFSASISSRLAVNQATAPCRASLKRGPSHARMGSVGRGVVETGYTPVTWTPWTWMLTSTTGRPSVRSIE